MGCLFEDEDQIKEKISLLKLCQLAGNGNLKNLKFWSSRSYLHNINTFDVAPRMATSNEADLDKNVKTLRDSFGQYPGNNSPPVPVKCRLSQEGHLFLRLSSNI